MKKGPPRLFELSQRVQLYYDQITNPVNMSDIYQSFADIMTQKAKNDDVYWTFDCKLLRNPKQLSGAVISNKYRLVGVLDDIISLAKLSGLTCKTCPNNICPERYFWMDLLEITRIN